MAKRQKRHGCCKGCGHPLAKHARYARGLVNRHGSALVCTVDKCSRWNECRDPAGKE